MRSQFTVSGIVSLIGRSRILSNSEILTVGADIESYIADIFSPTTIGDSLQSWEVNSLVGRVVSITGGTGFFLDYTANIFSQSTIGYTLAGWVPLKLKGQSVEIIAGTGNGQSRIILTNSGSLLTVDLDWDIVPDSSSVFRIKGQTAFVVANNSTTITIDSPWLVTPDGTTTFDVGGQIPKSFYEIDYTTGILTWHIPPPMGVLVDILFEAFIGDIVKSVVNRLLPVSAIPLYIEYESHPMDEEFEWGFASWGTGVFGGYWVFSV
jgi:hypothetical protein